MRFMKKTRVIVCGALPLLMAACSTPPAHMDYTAFKDAKPRSILVLPPINHTFSVKASYSFLSQMTHPLAESGYYVVPVGMELETFHQNGVSMPDEMAQIPAEKLHSIFGADAALYSTVTAYGSTYQVIDTVTMVSITAKLVDLKTGSVLWSGQAMASNKSSDNTNGNLIGQLIGAAVKKVGDSISDSSYPLAGIASERLLAAGPQNGSLLYGPRSPHYDVK